MLTWYVHLFTNFVCLVASRECAGETLVARLNLCADSSEHSLFTCGMNIKLSCAGSNEC